MSVVNALRSGRSGVVAASLLMQATLALAQVTPLSLRIEDEVVTPGGVLQAKLVLTEPRPITTGGGSMSFDGYDQFLGFAVNTEAGDAAAVGVMRGSTLRVRMVSPTSSIGAEGEYPILTTTLRVPSNATPGTRRLLTMSGSAFFGPGGTPYPYELDPGEVLVTQGASIIDVTPGSAFVPAGGAIVITGLGFEPDTRVSLKDTVVSSVQFVSPTALIVRPATGVTMHGLEVRLEIPSTQQRLFYNAYQRTAPLGRSGHPLFAAIEAAFPRASWVSASVVFPPLAAGRVHGVAVQNEGATASAVTLTLSTGGRVEFTLPAHTRAVRSLAEVFGSECRGGCTLQLGATSPIHLLGLAGDLAADAAMPLFASAAPPPPPPTVLDLTTSASVRTVRAGELLVVSGHATPGPQPVVVDAYFVLQFPSGEYRSFTPAGLVRGILPFARRVTVTSSASFDVLRAPIPAGTPVGTYQFLSAFAVPGTLSLVTPIRSTLVTVLP